MYDPSIHGFPTQRPAWKGLIDRATDLKTRHLRELFDADPSRAERFHVESAGFYFDYSKNLIDAATISLLAQLARECQVEERRDAMFAGAHINVSEDRAVLHTALRLPRNATLVVDGIDIVAEVHAVLDRMSDFATQIRRGEWLGYTGKPICNVVNIGIGGSDLGPVMAYEALRHYSDRGLTFRFVSNVDATDFVEAVRDLDAEETLFIVSSKTFGTLETLDERRLGAPLARRPPWRRGGRREALRCRLYQRGEGRRLRHRRCQHVRVLGLGRWALLDGKCHWPLDDDRCRSRALL